MRPPPRPRVPTPPAPPAPDPRRQAAARPARVSAPARRPAAGASADASAPEQARAQAPAKARAAAGPPEQPDRWQPRRPAVVSTGSAARFAERVRMRRRILRDRVLAWSVAGVVAAALAWLLLLSPVLALDADEVNVRVEGDRAVVDASAVSAILTDLAGTPLPRLDTVAVRREVLDVPGVRAASVTRSWPHGVLVTVVARDPVAAVPEGGGYALLDADGVQVGRSDDAPDDLPVLTVPLDDPAAMTAVLLVLQQLPSDLAADVVAASAENRDAVQLSLSDGTTVEWGSADQSALKAAVVRTLRASKEAAGVKVYDVSAPTLPITRS